VVEGNEILDTRRTILFGAFGAFYGGTVCHNLYYRVYPKLFPVVAATASTASKFRSMLAMNLCDNFINTPLIFFPTFYVMKEAIVCRGSIADAWQKYQNEMWDGCKSAWAMWLPVHAITFGLVPVHLRIAWSTSMSFLFYIIVSHQQSNFDRKRVSQDTDTILSQKSIVLPGAKENLACSPALDQNP
jgi:hypothetical protein